MLRTGGTLVVLIAVLVLAAYLVLLLVRQASPEAAIAAAIVAGAAIAFVAAFALRGVREKQDAIEGILTTSAPWLPGTLAVAIVALFILGLPAPWAIGIGLVVTAIGFLAVGFLLSGYARIDNAQPRNYAELLDRTARLQAEFDVLGDDARIKKLRDEEQENAQSARAEVQSFLKSITGELGTADGATPASGRAYALGTGYIDLWNRLHRAEEALIDLASDPNNLANAENDRLRLAGSNIGHADELIARLGDAVKTLKSANAAVPDKVEARRQLRSIRRDINKFRDDVWDQLLDMKNQLLSRMIFTGLVANLILILALLVGVDESVVLGASAFYLVGAITGLFGRLQSESSTKSVVDDYGLADARLIVTPLISGLAAVAGVVLTAKILLPGSDVLAPATIDDSGKTTQIVSEVRTPPELDQLFELDLNPGGLVVAAVFGLTPGLVLERLKAEAEKYKSDIQTSSATDGKK
ncbi:MAG TPA: hypothetical protein VJQ09_00500 [Candidatus Limnocylindria bacterium]|nr:hypothetical protein [Candidatus Limnocylindria bacterium]